MKFEILYNNMGDSYVVKLEDGRYVLVDTESGQYLCDDVDILCKFGMWDDVDSALVPDDIYEKIEKVLSNLDK